MAKQTLIHLSDIHIGRSSREGPRFARVVQSIARSYAGVPVLITGDLTDSATAGQLAGARGHLDVLAKTNPVLAVPGNHDYAWKGNYLRDGAWDRWVEHLGAPLGWSRAGVRWMAPDVSLAGIEGIGVWPAGDVVFFGIDSGDPNGREASARGLVTKRLADALGDQLETHAGKTRVAFLHHHPFDHNYFTALDGAKRLMKTLGGRCELLLFGHEHKLGVWWKKAGIPLIAASHKTTNTVFGDHLMITVIEISRVGTSDPGLWHRLELV